MRVSATPSSQLFEEASHGWSPFDLWGCAQVGMLVGTALLATTLAVDGIVSPLLAVSTAYLATLGSVVCLLRVRQANDERAWQGWVARFQARRPALVGAMSVAPRGNTYRMGRDLGQQLIWQAHRLPPVPQGLGASGHPHAAQIVLWAADELQGAPRGVRQGLRDAAQDLTIRAVHTDG